MSKKLATDEKLIATYGGVRVKMDIDRHDLWSNRADISVTNLWSTYARYPHMPRLASFKALADGTANLNWSQETPSATPTRTTATAGSAFERGARHPDHQWPAHPSRLRSHPEGGGGEDEGSSDEGGSEEKGEGGSGTSDTSKDGHGSGGPGATRFYAQFDLDSVRGIKQLGEILEHVTPRLGPNVELSLEIRAINEAGYDDATQRIVTENASNLGANEPEFEG